MHIVYYTSALSDLLSCTMWRCLLPSTERPEALRGYKTTRSFLFLIHHLSPKRLAASSHDIILLPFTVCPYSVPGTHLISKGCVSPGRCYPPQPTSR
jgi:hypothetical protein